MNKPALSIRGLKRTYATGNNELLVLNGVDIDLMPGELVGLVGPSGSGKSSLLHAAALLEKPQSGVIEIDGVNALDIQERDRTALRRTKIGFVYQFHHLLLEFDALDNVALPLMIEGVPRRSAREQSSKGLQTLGLGDRVHHRPGQLSGGEQQRVAIARALINKPQIVLADEPTGNLDPSTSDQVFAALKDACRQAGAAALVATHNLALAKAMDRVLTLKDGVVVDWS